MELTLTLAQLAIFTDRCAVYLDPCFGDSSRDATKRALEDALRPMYGLEQAKAMAAAATLVHSTIRIVA